MQKGVRLIQVGLLLTQSAFTVVSRTPLGKPGASTGTRTVLVAPWRSIHRRRLGQLLSTISHISDPSTINDPRRDMSAKHISIHWFRKGLRLHDNRALLEACEEASAVYPLYVVDSDPASPESRAGSLR